MILSDETYFIEFKRFLNESDLKKQCDECDLNDECEKCDLKKESDECDLKKETLSKKEKKKKERDKVSNQRKKSWNPNPDTETLKSPAGYKELKSLSKGVVKERKKRKKQCIKGQGNHGLDGRFVNPYDEKGSFSIGKGNTSGKDCDWGKSSRKSANRSHQWVRQPCGRNSKYRCKDGSAKWEESNDLVDSDSSSVPLKSISTDEIFDELKRRILDDPEIMQEQGKCFLTDLNKALQFCAAIASADKGVWPPKRT